jgi:hypothetical protein
VGEGWGWRDLALNPPGIGITHEATRRRQAEGVGADRSWRVGADGEFAVADLLATRTAVWRLDRLRGRGPGGACCTRSRTAYVPKARQEAQRVTAFLHTALTAAGLPAWAGRVPVRPLIVVVGGRLAVRQWPAGVTVVTSTSLVASLRGFPIALTPAQVAAVYALARRDTSWNPVSDHPVSDHPTPDNTAAEHSAPNDTHGRPGSAATRSSNHR